MKTIKMKKVDFMKEHKKLISLLKEGAKVGDKLRKEMKEQLKEKNKYKK